jgi:cyclic beta-1,2-glucan synthetase
VTAVRDGTTPGNAEKATAWEADARALAEGQRDLDRARPWLMQRFEPPRLVRPLERAQRHLVASSGGGATPPKAAEWFLDNCHLALRAARQVEEELPRGFVRHLPRLASGFGKGRPRIDALARALVARNGLLLDVAALRRFVNAYQEVSPLTIGELWALPTLLRATVLEHLVQLLNQLHAPFQGNSRHALPGQASGAEQGNIEPIPVDSAAGVERSIRALRVLDTVDWKVFFEETNRVEAILRGDPANVYARMDFETCDSYRKRIETLAWATGRSEDDVAELVVSLARGDASNERRGHVGYYLVAEGGRALEARLGYRPHGIGRVRRVITGWPSLSYFVPLGLLTAVLVIALGWYLTGIVGQPAAPRLLIAVAVLVAVIPSSVVAVAALQFAFARLLPPRRLPKLDFEKGLSSETRTLVVMPTLLGGAEDVAVMLRQIELHYLSNPDPQIQFALLTDDADGKTLLEISQKSSLLESASGGIAALNVKHGKGGHGPFHLLHRQPGWNPAEECFMGWERKRGKLQELNRLLRGDTQTSYSRHVGDPAGLSGVRFIITLDSDTDLPMGSAQRLVGLLAHPLNRAVFDPATGRVSAGYTIVQPRIEISPASSRPTLFARIFAGDVGFDIYTHACSELYQDLFGSGIYIGKGIYEIDTFMRSVKARAPENVLLSHDLFEGVHGRTALATDILLFEGYPESYAAYALRLHRWVRGDWQLLPWLLPRVPSAHGDSLGNQLTLIDRWKIADNLRRSLTAPSLLILLVLGWTWLPGSAALWTLAALASLAALCLAGHARGHQRYVESLGRFALAIAFLPYEASVAVDAMVRTLVRTSTTRKHLLQWNCKAPEFGVDSRSSNAAVGRTACWRTMISSPVLASAIAALVVCVRPSAFVVAAPLLLVWIVAPELARWLSQDTPSRASQLTSGERKKLRLLARRTWRFFDAFVGPNDQWLPVDNYQEEPREQTAHRTSPTNIGLMLVSTLSAYDFGYIGPSELSIRVRRAFDSITRMAHYEGHLLNWYDTKNLQPLLPRYISTVDSGNLAGCLLALKHGCSEVAAAPIVRAAAWDGLCDSLELLDEVVASVPLGAVGSIRSVVARMQQLSRLARDNLPEAYATLRMLCDDTSAELDRELLAFLEASAPRHEADLLRALRTAIDRLHHQLQQMRRELDALLPWLALRDEAASLSLELPTRLRLGEIPGVSRRLRIALSASESERHERGVAAPKLDAAARRLDEAFRRADEHATALVAELLALTERADEEVRGMDFKLLYDGERKLFHVGYNASLDQVDAHHYDLLASEARLASYVAIVKRDVPESHWYALGRPMTRVAGGPALLSWGGTMFEYLMPSLLMRSQDGTLLARSVALAVAAQIAHAKRNKHPWGISESAYARVDADQTYQYRSFGVPALGLKRGLEEDRVVSPYASLLAVSIQPRSVVANLSTLEAMGMLGIYGLFEALDFTPERSPSLPRAQAFAIVRSYMAHHQGMIFIALGNFLNGRSMVDRFHSDALIQTGEVLLNEYVPRAAPVERPPMAPVAVTVVRTPRPPTPWLPPDRAGPQAFALSNGQLTSVLTSSGGGGLYWQGLALTRYELGAARVDDEAVFYLRDDESRRIWRVTSGEGRTTYAMHKGELHFRNEGISVHIDVAVAVVDDVEVRQVTLHNETNRPRCLTLTSAGRPVLLAPTQAEAHPVFSSLFVESEWIAELEALLFARRPQTAEEKPAVLVHRLVREGAAVSFAGYESDRAAFLGRVGSPRAPLALVEEGRALRGRVGAVLDPIMSLMARVDLAPKGSATLAFVTTIGRSRAAAVGLARKYGSMHAVRWAFRDAEQESPRRLQRTKLEPSLLPTVQRLFSALLFVDSTLRMPPDVRAANPACQRRLWGRGISGDDPIVLVRVSNPEAPLLCETLAAQRYLRSCGVRFDVVLINEHGSGYVTDGHGTLASVLAQNEVDDWLNRHAGVFVIAADQVSASEIRHLEVCARVVLDTRDGSLAARLGRVVALPPALPRLEPTLDDEAAERPRPRPRTLHFDNGSGGFTEEGREYVIDLPAGKSTPAPWCNVLSNPEFGCLVSESSLGATWSLNSGENRLTPWRNDPVIDEPSEALYLRDEGTAAVWSPTPLPAGQSGHVLVRHGAGYTTYERESHGLVQELTVFVPPDAPLKVLRLRIKNTLARHRRLTATYYAEWVLGSRREGQRPYIVSEFDADHGCLLATCDWNAEFGGRVAFLASRTKTHGFTADRGEFLGPRGDYARPEALERVGLSGRVDLGADPCAALQVRLALDPGEEVETHFILGQSSTRDGALNLVARFRDAAVVEAAWRALHAFWDGILDTVRVKTPEPAMDLMLNRWLLYQTLSSRIFGRTGFYQSSGAFGYRDQLQDVLALLYAAPTLARAHILEAAKHQFEQGDVLHWWHPPSGRGVRTRCSDDMAWLPYVTSEYVAATGDTEILDEEVPFLAGDPLAPDEPNRYAQYTASANSAPLFEHCRRAVEHAVTAGAHGLPLMGDGDWNDGMSRIGAEGRGESVWLGWFLCATMDRFASLSARRNDNIQASKWRARAALLRSRIEAVAWDGAWYVRAFHDDGSLVGSATSGECRIDSIAQSWAVLGKDRDAGFDARTRAALRTTDEQLVRESDRLALLFWPPFDTTLHDPGYVRAYPPGIRENGGQYTHAATWLGFAHAGLGDGRRAERIFRLLNPVLRTLTLDACARYRVEPYALAGDIYSCPPWIGRGGWTWYTGSAACMWRLGVEAILGLRMVEGQLRIDPCIPPIWEGFEAWVRFGQQRIHIVVENPDRVATGVATMTLEGVRIEPNLLALDPNTAGTPEVLVRLGAVARSVLDLPILSGPDVQRAGAEPNASNP